MAKRYPSDLQYQPVASKLISSELPQNPSYSQEPNFDSFGAISSELSPCVRSQRSVISAFVVAKSYSFTIIVPWPKVHFLNLLL